jgi:hypothetical protein
VSNTYPNHTGYVERIHATLPVAETIETVSISLSSQESSLAHIDLENITSRRRLGRRVLELDVVDRSGFAEIRGNDAAVQRLRIPLGHTAVIGRNRMELPLLESEIISEEHLVLGYVRTDGSDSLTIHDNRSANGSHLIGDTEKTWQERTIEMSNDTDDHPHVDTTVDDVDWEWLYDADKQKPVH